MNTKKNSVSFLIIIISICLGRSQGFINLNFESAKVVFNGFQLSVSNALPGWAAYLDATPKSSVGYDTLSAGGAAVFLEDSNAPTGGGPLPIQGNYSVLLEGISGVFPSNPTAASIGQTGTIPNTAQSLTFYLSGLYGNFQVSFDGQPLSFMAISNTLNYTIYGANISSYAGQTGQLLFTAPFQSGALLDNIQFSSVPIPEPAESALVVLGALILGFHFRRSRRG
jgi:hypothetical protein